MANTKLGPYELNSAVLGDCLEVMGQIPDNSVDSIVTDSPYGLGNDPDMVELLTHWLNDKDYDTGPGFMSRAWDVVPGPAVWRECYRVMKPGGCLMAFGGTRTCDLLSIAIRLAGFERFDSLCWLHGQGFSKGLAVDRGIDSLLGKAGEREVIGSKLGQPGYSLAPSNGDHRTYGKGLGNTSDPQKECDITAPATEAAKLFNGWRSQLKPSHEVILCFWKPREKSFAFNALKWGVAGLNIDECRIPTNGEVFGGGEKMSSSGETLGSYGHYESDGFKISTNGRFPANVLISHHESCVRVGVKQVKSGMHGDAPGGFAAADLYGDGNTNQDVSGGYADPDGCESVPDYRCHPDCAVLQLDRQAGVRKSGGSGKIHPSPIGYAGGSMYETSKRNGHARDISDSGSASRFFYTPKAPPREKWFYCEICDDVFPYKERDDHAHGKPKGRRKHQVAHPTVKPLTICNYALGVLEYLCRLTKTPTGGVILDLFAGSGTTGLAALANGRPFLLIENDPIYHRIAQKRIEQAMKEPHQLKLL